jgi:hypothetical protein
VERGDLVTARGFVLSVQDGTVTVTFPGAGQQVTLPAEALEQAPDGPASAAAYAAALTPVFAAMLQDER